MSEKPKNWNIENGFDKISVSEYQQIRKKLIWQAQMAWRSGRHQDAKIIMAKASRYKQDIGRLLEQKKIGTFMKNNSLNSMGVFSNKEAAVDLHGLSCDEAKLIIHKKIKDISERRNYGMLSDSHKFVLNIITGRGSHSNNNQPVLLPRLTEYLKQNRHQIKVDQSNGIIKVFL